jgi:hypothetical protein
MNQYNLTMKNTIHYALILDQSGSMQSLKQEVISSFNEQVEMTQKIQRNQPDTYIKFTLCVFNDMIDFKYTGSGIEYLKKLTPIDYQPDSYTALYDAIGRTILRIKKIVNPGDEVFLAVFTDGLENASTDFSAGVIRIQLAQADEKGWRIRFFCQDEDNIFYKRDLGINDSHILNITLNEAGFKTMESEICYCLNRMVKTKNQ